MTLNRKQLVRRAIGILKNNDRKYHTVPSPRLYPHQWAWDSAFAAIGWLHIDPDRALVELESLFSAQWLDGRIPHIRFDPASTGYTPGPELWGCAGTSSITQPPVYAMALRRIYEAGVSVDSIRHLLDPIERAHQFYRQKRDPKGLNLVAVAHPWESGLDNSPSWDKALQRINPDNAPSFERTDKEIVSDPDQRPTDDQYRRYMAIVREIADNDFEMGSFSVYDPLMTAILVKAEDDLAFLAKECGIDSKAAIRSKSLLDGLVNHLWNADSKRFHFLDSISDQTYTPDIIAAYLPLILDDLPVNMIADLQNGLHQNYQTPFLLPTTSPDDPSFSQHCYWRGPVWVNMNWLLSPVLGNDLVEATIDMVARSGFREYFDPFTGEGLGAEQFTWTAALVIDWLSSTTD